MSPNAATSFFWVKTSVGIAAIFAIAVIAALKVVAAPDAIAFTKWVIVAWMGSGAIVRGADRMATAMQAKANADAGKDGA